MNQEYYGTKIITAWREDKQIEGTDEMKPGYAVKYEDGYQSWSSIGVFEKAYQPIFAMSFGHALHAMLQGHSVTRGWNRKGMKVQSQLPNENSKMKQPYFYMDPGDGSNIPWFPSNLDLFANDWMIVK